MLKSIIKRKEFKLFISFIIFDFILYLIGYPIPCVFHKITGLYCPGCGVTRMLIHILKLDFKKAFLYNPVCFIYLMIFIIYIILNTIFKITIKKEHINRIAIIGLIILIIFGIIRNLPIFSFLIID